MQNVVNTLIPFLADGKPIVGGRVHFVSLNSDSEYIPIYDTNGTPLKNPLGLNAQGVYETQPFAPDEIDFKGIVEAPTGLPPLYEDDSPCWKKVYEFTSRQSVIEYHFEGMTQLDTIDDLKSADPALGSILVLGYNDRNDDCPARIYVWNESAEVSDTGWMIKSDKSSFGAWELKGGPFVDVRWFGIDKGTTECAQRLRDANTMAIAYGVPVVFPSGNYRLGASVNLSAVILGRFAKFVCVDSVGEVYVTIERLLNVGYGAGVPFNKDHVVRLELLGGKEYRTDWLLGSEWTETEIADYLSHSNYQVCKNCEKLVVTQNKAGIKIAANLNNAYNDVKPNLNAVVYRTTHEEKDVWEEYRLGSVVVGGRAVLDYTRINRLESLSTINGNVKISEQENEDDGTIYGDIQTDKLTTSELNTDSLNVARNAEIESAKINFAAIEGASISNALVSAIHLGARKVNLTYDIGKLVPTNTEREQGLKTSWVRYVSTIDMSTLDAYYNVGDVVIVTAGDNCTIGYMFPVVITPDDKNFVYRCIGANLTLKRGRSAMFIYMGFLESAGNPKLKYHSWTAVCPTEGET